MQRSRDKVLNSEAHKISVFPLRCHVGIRVIGDRQKAEDRTANLALAFGKYSTKLNSFSFCKANRVTRVYAIAFATLHCGNIGFGRM